MSEKLRIELGDKYVVTGSAHDLILHEKKIVKEGKNAGTEILSRLGYFGKFEHLVRELMHKEILESEAQTQLQNCVTTFISSARGWLRMSDYDRRNHLPGQRT